MPTQVRIKKASEGISLINIVAIVVLIALVGIGGHFLGKFKENKVEVSTSSQISGVQTFSYEGENGKNALELLKSKADAQVSESSLGSFVMSIDGTGNSDSQFWMLYVNGELATTGADQVQTKDGDKIDWRFETF
ncbi:MAG: DUF4430 domain-containing protein [Candidatus Berkelbacteria bacterium]|nr:DUF4430 domain-containing protein [Candidatus Berkelbacteria bacterium]